MGKYSRQSLSSLVSKRWLVVAGFVAIAAGAAVTLVISRNAMPRVELCSTHNLSGSAELQGETGAQVGTMTIENTGPRACRLPTRPTVVLGRTGGALTTHQKSMADELSKSFGGASLSVLAPHAKAAVAHAWYNWCPSRPPAPGPFRGSLLVSLSHSSSPLRIDFTSPEAARCDFPLEQSTLTVGRFRSPWTETPPSATSHVSLPSNSSAANSVGVSPSGFGWALTTAGLELTANCGRSFSVVQSPVPVLNLRDVFVNGTGVTVAGQSNFLPSIESSSDSGVTWKSVTLPPGSRNAGDVKLVTHNGTVIGMMVRDVTSINFSVGEWYGTSDGGATWTHHSTPSGGVVTGVGGDLWLAGGVQSASLYRSADRGVTWSKVSIPAAAITQGAALSVPGGLSNGKVVLVATTPNLSAASTFGVTVYVSGNRGARWSVLSRTSFVGQISSGVIVAASIVGDTIWLGATTDGKFVIVSANGTLITTRSIGGVYPGGSISLISASGSSSAWVKAVKGECPSGKASCTELSALMRTIDGGRTWALVNLDPVPIPLASN